MSGEPFPDLPDAEFPFADGFSDEPVCRERFDFQIMAVDTQKRVRRRETDSLVAVEEGMVIGVRFHQRGGFMNQIVVVSALRTKDGSFQEPPVPKPMNSTKLLDELPLRTRCHPAVNKTLTSFLQFMPQFISRLFQRAYHLPLEVFP